MSEPKDKVTSEKLLVVGTDDVVSGATLVDQASDDRDLRRGLREVASGIELIFKAILAAEHWTQVLSEPRKAKRSDFVSGEVRSVGAEEAVSRVINVVGLPVEKAHQEKLTSLRKARNNLEHLGVMGNELAVRGKIGAAAHVVLEVLKLAEQAQLGEQFSNLPEELVSKLAESDSFVSERMKEVMANFPPNAQPEQCVSCGQHSVVVDGGTNCLFCGRKEGPEAAASTFLEEVLGESSYRYAKEGVRWPVYRCPECGDEALAFEQSVGFHCFACAEKFGLDDLSFCCECEEPMQRDDEGMIICEDCLGAKINRDD